LTVGFVLADAVGFLDLADELIAATVDLGDLVVGQLAPLRLDLTVNCFQLPSTRFQFMLAPLLRLERRDRCSGAEFRHARSAGFAN